MEKFIDYLDPKRDFVFKRLFSDENSKDVLLSFINAVLKACYSLNAALAALLVLLSSESFSSVFFYLFKLLFQRIYLVLLIFPHLLLNSVLSFFGSSIIQLNFMNFSVIKLIFFIDLLFIFLIQSLLLFKTNLVALYIFYLIVKPLTKISQLFVHQIFHLFINY